MTQVPDSRGRVQHRTNSRSHRWCNGCSNRYGFLPPDAFGTVRKGDRVTCLAYCRSCESVRAVRRVDERRKRMTEQEHAVYRRRDAEARFRGRRIERDRYAKDAADALRVLLARGMTIATIVAQTGISDTTLRLIRAGGHRPYSRTAHTLFRAAFGGAS